MPLLSEATLRRLVMYLLRADVQITPSELKVQRGLGEVPEGALPEPARRLAAHAAGAGEGHSPSSQRA